MGPAVIDKGWPIRSIGLSAFFSNAIQRNLISSLSNKVFINFDTIRRHGSGVIDIRVAPKTVVRARAMYAQDLTIARDIIYPLTRQRPRVIDKDSLLLLIGYLCLPNLSNWSNSYR